MPEPRNWSNLPSELVHLIYKKIPADRICVHRFRAVCKNWRSSAPLSDLPPQLPWLIERDSSRRNSYLGSNLRLYSLATGNTGTICVPEAYRTMVYYRPGNGFLFVSSLEDNFYLLNPLTGYAISLPKPDDGLTIWSPVVSGSDPMHNWHLVSYRKNNWGDWGSVIYNADVNDWKYVESNLNEMSCNTCCWDGKLFVIEDGCNTQVFDAVTREVLYEVPPPEDEDFQEVLATYLVESCGEILRVSRYFVSDGTDKAEFPMFDINKLFSEGGEEHSWAKVSDIGDQILFLDLMNGFSLRASAGFEGNCIYFFLDDGSTPCRYDIGTKTVEILSCPFRSCTWFIPNFG